MFIGALSLTSFPRGKRGGKGQVRRAHARTAGVTFEETSPTNMRPSVALLATVLFVRPVHSQRGIEPLTGVSTMRVLVEGLDAAATSAGLDSDRVRTVTELRLRLAGIRVVTTSEASNPGSGRPPFVYVNLNAISTTSGSFAIAVSVELADYVNYKPNGAWVKAVLWESGSIVAAKREAITAEKILGPTLDSFINAYLAANPKQPLP